MPTRRMRPFGDTIPLHAARAIAETVGDPITRIETTSLIDSHNRVLATDVVATQDVPPFSRAAMDGYAVRAADTEGASRATPRLLHHIATLYTGQVSQHSVGSGECIEIATGAPLPEGADCVVMVEETDVETDDRIRVYGRERWKGHESARR